MDTQPSNDVCSFNCDHRDTKSIFEHNPQSSLLFLCKICGKKKNEAGDWVDN